MGAIYREEGAVWYRATRFGGEKDEVLVRQNGIPTYFAADIASAWRGTSWTLC